MSLFPHTPRALTELPWHARFVERLPGDPEKRNFTRLVREVCYSAVTPTPVRAPKLIGWASGLAEELGLMQPTPAGEGYQALELLAGNSVLPTMRPYAARYGGHQFGHWAGQLGDGRAITLGEFTSPRQGKEYELQLKGSGLTPYSRTADGRAVLRSSLREFLCSEAMHYLGVPTTRALSLVATGERVVRDMFYDGHPQAEPGAVVCRIAPSFLRFGNFQIHAAHQEFAILKTLTQLLLTNHYPQFDRNDPDVYGLLLDEVCRRTAVMVAHWMRVGFVHGVMNTDNMSVLGLTIDYGPYGWLEPYEPNWTPNTTDAGRGRYRFAHQPDIAGWNLARFAEALYPLIQDEARLYASLDIYQKEYEAAYQQMLAQKLGLTSLASPGDQSLVEDLWRLMEEAEVDFTVFFRALGDWQLTSADFSRQPLAAFERLIVPAFYSTKGTTGKLQADWLDWFARYGARLKQEPTEPQERRRLMHKANPRYVPRNYLAQNAITAAEQGDLRPLERLSRVLQTPYEDQVGEDDLAAKRPEWARNTPGCSALSCSS